MAGDRLMALAKDTELIAFGVCHDNPRLVTLANVDTLRAMSLKACSLSVPADQGSRVSLT